MGQIVACSAQEEHRDRDLAKMLGPFCVRLPRLVKRKREEDQALHARRGETREAAVDVMRPLKEWPPASSGRPRAARAAAATAERIGRGADFLRVSALAVLHVREVVAERRDCHSRPSCLRLIWSVAWRMCVLAPWPSTRRWVAFLGRSRARRPRLFPGWRGISTLVRLGHHVASRLSGLLNSKRE